MKRLRHIKEVFTYNGSEWYHYWRNNLSRKQLSSHLRVLLVTIWNNWFFTMVSADLLWWDMTRRIIPPKIINIHNVIIFGKVLYTDWTDILKIILTPLFCLCPRDVFIFLLMICELTFSYLYFKFNKYFLI